jgi:hypothetical protein
MHVVFYNFYHSGDLFFMKEILKVIAENNPPHRFYLSTNCCSALYKDTNLTIIPITHIHKVVKDRDKYYYDPYHDNLYIDTWAGRHNYKRPVNDMEEVHQVFKRMMDEIVELYGNNMNLRYDITDYKDVIPQIGEVAMSSGLMPQVLTPSIFYYNVDSQSSQCPNYNHNYIISCLCRDFPYYQIIVAKKCNVGAPNLVALEGIIETAEGDNLLQYAHVAGRCDVVIMKDCGACFYYFNKENMVSDKEQHVILVSTDDTVGMTLSKFLLNDTKTLHQVHLDNKLHLKLQNIINNLSQ